MKKKNLIVFSLFLLIVIFLVSLVHAVGTNDVSLLTPTNATWWNNGLNYTPGFVFSWNDPGDISYNTSFCVLYIGNNSNLTLLVHESKDFRNLSNVNRSTLTTNYTITMNQSFPLNDTTYYWTIECCNESSTPDCWYPTPRQLYLDNTTIPSLNVTTYFTNASWDSTGNITFDYYVYDLGDIRGKINCFHDNATNSTECGAIGTSGGYSSNSTWLTTAAAVNAYDNNFSSYAEFNTSATNGSSIFVNYTKPTGYLSAKWMIKGGEGTERNLTIKDTCLNTTIMRFRMDSLWQLPSDASKYYCYDTEDADWYLLYTDTTNGRIYEDAMWWYIDHGWTNGTFRVQILNYSNDYVFQTENVDNSTSGSITYVASDGNYTVKIRASDPANNTNTSGPYEIYMDSTSPVVTFTDPTLANDTSQSATHIYVNMSITDNYFHTALINFDGTDYYTLEWTSWDDIESAGSGGASAYDEDWTNSINSTTAAVLLYENYTDHANTNFEDLTQIEFMFQINVTNASGRIEVSFYNHSNNLWASQYINNTNTSGAPANTTITVSTYTAVGWTSWSDIENAGSGGANAYDEDWSTYVNSISSGVSLYENYTDHSNTSFVGLDKIEFMFQMNMTNSSAEINVSFYNISSTAWVNLHTNSTSVAKVNYTISVTSGANYYANSTDPFQVRIDLANTVGNNGTGRYYEGRTRFYFNRTLYANINNPFQVLINVSNNWTENNGTAKYYEGRARFYVERCSESTSCYYNFTNVGDKKDIKYNITVNDSAGNTGTTATRYVSVDTTSPSILEAYNWTYSDSVINFRIRTNDTTASACTAQVYDRDNIVRTNITATLASSVLNGDTNFTGTIEGDNVSIDGAFTIVFNVTDEVNNSVLQNMTGMYTKLYDGWNLIGYMGANETGVGKEVYEICADTQYCTQMSYFYNIVGNKSFVTYSTSTPSVNNDTRIHPGYAVHIYTSADSYILSKDERPSAGDTVGPVAENITVATQGWNTLGLITAGNITSIWNATNMTSLIKPITYVSYINQSAETYYTCRKSIELCAGTSTTPTNLKLYEGWGVWVLSNANVSLNRSTI